MTGKKRSWLARSAAALLLVPALASAMPVEDPISYTYYVQQIKKMETQVQEAEAQVNKMDEVRQGVVNIATKLQGHYNRVKGFVDGMKNTVNSVTGFPSTIDQEAKAFGATAQGVKNGEVGNYEDAKTSLDGFFVDPRASDHYSPSAVAVEFSIRQHALKHAIASSDALLKGMPVRLAKIKELAGQIDTTKNLKDAQDLTNRLLAELLRTVTELLAVDSRMTEATSLDKYKGVTDAATKQQLQKIKDAQDNSGAFMSGIEKRLTLSGADLKHFDDTQMETAIFNPGGTTNAAQ